MSNIEFKNSKLTVKGNKAVIKYDKNNFMDNAEDKDGLKKACEYLTEYTQQAQEEAIEASAKIIENDASIDRVEVNVPFGTNPYDKYTITVDRANVVRNVKDGSSSVRPTMKTKSTSSITGKKSIDASKKRLVTRLQNL